VVRQKPAKLPFPSSNLGATFTNVKFVLYLVSTPIGNLEDISFRAVAILKSCDYILCEDTRHSRVLLDRYEIKTSLKAFHQFNEASKEDLIIEDLKGGKTIALISDAGHELVVRCRAEEIPVSAVPGPCALIQALVLSGFPAQPFQFIGFLPKKENELRALLTHVILYPGTTVAYESPHRVKATFEILALMAQGRKLCVARELTKLHEEVLSGTAQELLTHFKAQPPRGEFVLLISPPTQNMLFENLSLTELVEMFQKDLHLTKPEAIKMAAQMRGIPKKEVYKHFFND
jgi:16S rRNA (cytidine1402-2'-O)-methyltransferase